MITFDLIQRAKKQIIESFKKQPSQEIKEKCAKCLQLLDDLYKRKISEAEFSKEFDKYYKFATWKTMKLNLTSNKTQEKIIARTK